MGIHGRVLCPAINGRYTNQAKVWVGSCFPMVSRRRIEREMCDNGPRIGGRDQGKPVEFCACKSGWQVGDNNDNRESEERRK